MENFTYFAVARALHVVGVVLWIGGVAFVTTTLIPSLREMADADQRLRRQNVQIGRLQFADWACAGSNLIGGHLLLKTALDGFDVIYVVTTQHPNG